MALAGLMEAIDRCPKPVVGVIQGAAFGGGVGLVACCDIAIASSSASFSLSEVRLGLIPAVISPYVAAAIGPRACRRYFLTAERFDAATAAKLGLVHRVAEPEALEAARDEIIKQLLTGGPAAQAAAKELIRRVAFAPNDEALRRDTAARIAEARASAEGKEGIAAFLEKRKPNWS
jgi:methylglutaconyl-CoA hydratase